MKKAESRTEKDQHKSKSMLYNPARGIKAHVGGRKEKFMYMTKCTRPIHLLAPARKE